ncbi:MAG: hypothetical protein ABI690_04375 [Chloroflexota bacterium]
MERKESNHRETEITERKSEKEIVLSRHRLPRVYRVSIVGFWIAPIFILVTAILVSQGLSAVMLDPRFWLPLAIMVIPALYIWHEGVDVLSSGVVSRVHWPRYYAYHQLDNWYYDSRPDRRTLTIWDAQNRKVLECRAGHLTDLPTLLAALKSNLRNRNWPM